MTEREARGRILAGDVGGTKTILALYASDDVRAPRVLRTYDSRAQDGLDEALDDILAGGPPPVAAAFAVAGPVVDDAVHITNLRWGLSRRDLAVRLSTPRVVLLNDVAALVGAVEELAPTEVAVLQEGRRDPRGATGVLALGTGLGMAYVARNSKTLAATAHPSEGGHADFAPASPLQARLLASLAAELGHVSVERVASGLAVPRIYRFLVDEERRPEEPAVRAALDAGNDATPAIIAAALSGASTTCREAVAVLCDTVAAAAGNLALTLLATGGIYLGGGLAPRLLPFLSEPRFLGVFCAKGRFESLLRRVPVSIVLAPHAVLWGAAYRALQAAQSPDA